MTVSVNLVPLKSTAALSSCSLWRWRLGIPYFWTRPHDIHTCVQILYHMSTHVQNLNIGSHLIRFYLREILRLEVYEFNCLFSLDKDTNMIMNMTEPLLMSHHNSPSTWPSLDSTCKAIGFKAWWWRCLGGERCPRSFVLSVGKGYIVHIIFMMWLWNALCINHTFPHFTIQNDAFHRCFKYILTWHLQTWCPWCFPGAPFLASNIHGRPHLG